MKMIEHWIAKIESLRSTTVRYEINKSGQTLPLSFAYEYGMPVLGHGDWSTSGGKLKDSPKSKTKKGEKVTQNLTQI
ncbi:hypothetical protein TNCV_4787961 [Trichonephila clavipes]|nr:hypothetical protein TNCV_4787961 [Trichonephila clavipes]